MTRNLSISTNRNPVTRATHLAWKDWASDLAVIATFASVLGLFLVSGITLEAEGIPYITSGGGLFSKLHPSTFLAMVALGLRCLATRHPLRTAWNLMTDDTGVVLLASATLFAFLIAVGVAHTPMTPLIDTFLLPIFLFVLLRDFDPMLLRRLAIMIALVLCANAVIALIEFLGGWRLVQIDIPANVTADPTQANAVFSWQAQFINEWRATALLGHPLVNGSIVGAFLLCLAASGSRWIPVRVSVPLAGLQFASMFAFGARAALVLTIVFGAILLLQRTVAGLARGARLQPRVLAIGLVGVAVAIGLVGILIELNFFDKMIDRFSQDSGSAETRVTMFELLTALPLGDLMLGPDQDLVATLQRVYGLEFGIESSWIGLVLVYGLIVTASLAIGLLALSRSVLRACGEGALMILAFYFILASVAATLSTKTTSLAMTLCLILLFLPRDPRPIATRSKGTV